MKVDFIYMTPDGSTAADIILSGTITVADDSTEEQIKAAAREEAFRIMREEPERVINKHMVPVIFPK